MMFSLTLLSTMVILSVHAYRPGEVSSFFLKAPKSVPRAGRAAPDTFDSFFLKASKSVPRVGRRDGTMLSDSSTNYWPRADDLKSTQPGQYEYWQNSADAKGENTYDSDINAKMAKNFYNYLTELSTLPENPDESYSQRRNHYIQEKNGYSDLNKELEDAKYQRQV